LFEITPFIKNQCDQRKSPPLR